MPHRLGKAAGLVGKMAVAARIVERLPVDRPFAIASGFDVSGLCGNMRM